MPVEHHRVCVKCGTDYTSTYNIDRAKYCKKCRDGSHLQYKRLTQERSANGAAGEAAVCADLLRCCWFVFKAFSAHGPCDLVILRRGVAPLRVEVKAGSIYHNGARSYAKPNSRHEYDVLAIAYPDRIEYVAVDGSVWKPE